MAISGSALIKNFHLYFDGGDAANASLYLCTGWGLSDGDAQTIIARMRSAGLWSADAAKQVPPEQKSMYEKEMTFIGSLTGSSNGKVFYVAAYDHPKYKYHPERWRAWQKFVTDNYP